MTALNVISLPPSNPEDTNVCVLFNLYVGVQSPRVRVLSECAMKLLSSSYFNALRTQETLGYIVFAHPLRYELAAHVVFAAQSAIDGVNGLYLLSRIIAYLSAVQTNLNSICSDSEVNKIVSGLIKQREKLPQCVQFDCDQLNRDYCHPSGLHHRQDEISTLKQITANDVREFFHSFILNHRKPGHALAIVINSSKTLNDDVFQQNGTYTVQLPAKRSSDKEISTSQENTVVNKSENKLQTQISENADNASEVTSADDKELQLPSFTQPTNILVHSWKSINEFQRDLRVLPSSAFITSSQFSSPLA